MNQISLQTLMAELENLNASSLEERSKDVGQAQRADIAEKPLEIVRSQLEKHIAHFKLMMVKIP